jgi:hypothetical protein
MLLLLMLLSTQELLTMPKRDANLRAEVLLRRWKFPNTYTMVRPCGVSCHDSSSTALQVLCRAVCERHSDLHFGEPLPRDMLCFILLHAANVASLCVDDEFNYACARR